ncbi:MAG: acetate/propionate family kinase [Pseudomonadales bacterium]
MKAPLIIACNSGSSSCKLAIYQVRAGTPLGIGRLYLHWQSNNNRFDKVEQDLPADFSDLPVLEHREDLPGWLSHVAHLAHNNHSQLVLVHRVVHGGADYHRPLLATKKIIKALRKLSPLAPLHQPACLELIDLIRTQLPEVKQVLCFDTAFHHHTAPLQQLLPLPQHLTNMGLRRYGFHGLSYEYLTTRLQEQHPEWAPKKQVYAHLGSGASVCAIKDWTSVDSSMGFTALDGLPMATRPGAIDPGALLFLMDQGYSARDLEKLLYRKSGLLGISGLSSDIRMLLDHKSERAALAVDYFCWKTAQNIAQMCVTLGGLDVLVFSGGIGENQPRIIKKICGQLAFLGVPEMSDAPLNKELNYLSAPSADTHVLSIKTNEELMMVRHCHKLLKEPVSC